MNGVLLVEVMIDWVLVYLCVIDELFSVVCYVVEWYVNNSVEFDYVCLKVWLRPMRGLKVINSLCIVVVGYVFV